MQSSEKLTRYREEYVIVRQTPKFFSNFQSFTNKSSTFDSIHLFCRVLIISLFLFLFFWTNKKFPIEIPLVFALSPCVLFFDIVQKAYYSTLFKKSFMSLTKKETFLTCFFHPEAISDMSEKCEQLVSQWDEPTGMDIGSIWGESLCVSDFLRQSTYRNPIRILILLRLTENFWAERQKESDGTCEIRKNPHCFSGAASIGEHFKYWKSIVVSLNPFWSFTVLCCCTVSHLTNDTRLSMRHLRLNGKFFHSFIAASPLRLVVTRDRNGKRTKPCQFKLFFLLSNYPHNYGGREVEYVAENSTKIKGSGESISIYANNFQQSTTLKLLRHILIAPRIISNNLKWIIQLSTFILLSFFSYFCAANFLAISRTLTTSSWWWQWHGHTKASWRRSRM